MFVLLNLIPLNLDIFLKDVYAHKAYWAYAPSLNKQEHVTS